MLKIADVILNCVSAGLLGQFPPGFPTGQLPANFGAANFANFRPQYSVPGQPQSSSGSYSGKWCSLLFVPLGYSLKKYVLANADQCCCAKNIKKTWLQVGIVLANFQWFHIYLDLKFSESKNNTRDWVFVFAFQPWFYGPSPARTVPPCNSLKAFSILDAFVCMLYVLAAESNIKQTIFQIIATKILLPTGKNVVCV